METLLKFQNMPFTPIHVDYAGKALFDCITLVVGRKPAGFSGAAAL